MYLNLLSYLEDWGGTCLRNTIKRCEDRVHWIKTRKLTLYEYIWGAFKSNQVFWVYKIKEQISRSWNCIYFSTYSLPCSIYTLIRAFNPLNAELNPIRHLLALVGARHIVHPIRHLLALVGARHIVHVSRIRVNQSSTLRKPAFHTSICELTKLNTTINLQLKFYVTTFYSLQHVSANSAIFR